MNDILVCKNSRQKYSIVELSSDQSLQTFIEGEKKRGGGHFAI